MALLQAMVENGFGISISLSTVIEYTTSREFQYGRMFPQGIVGRSTITKVMG